MHLYIHSIAIHNNQVLETAYVPRLSVNKCIKKLWNVYTMEYYALERKKELLPFVTAWVELDNILLSEISWVVKDKYHVISPIRGI